MDPIKEAFLRIKEEISSLKEEISNLSKRISIIETPQVNSYPTLQTGHPTDNSTQNPTLPQEIRGSKTSFIDVSTGNKGVSTDNSTNKPTNQQTNKSSLGEPPHFEKDPFLALERAKSALDSLDSIKKEIRIRFKRLTNKEMMVFSTIYALEERGIDEITYKLLANNLNLTESSIRDYINRLILKGIPLRKLRLNNKTIYLKIDDDFQKIASLQTLLKLREL
jgi:hypothetical protein